MKKSPDKFVTYNLQETYYEFGTYLFKIVLHPKIFKSSHDSEVTLVDSDGRPMKLVVNKWGRKLNCSFVVDGTVSDGVSVAKISAKDDKGNVHSHRVSFWIVKP